MRRLVLAAAICGGLVAALAVNVFITGINQLEDVEIGRASCRERV